MGRKAGIPNKATKAREELLARQGIMPLGYMLEVLRDPKKPHEERMKAAIAAAPYVHPRLATSTVDVKGDMSLTIEIVKFANPPAV